MSPASVWIWSIAAGVLLTGLAVITWALIGDRPRGRRRCPRCWYDMAGIPGLTCPECGHEPGDERGLFRTRRRWRWAAIGLTAVVMSVAPLGGWISRNGWSAVPSPILIAIWPWASDPTTDPLAFAGYSRTWLGTSPSPSGPGFDSEFYDRLFQGQLSGSQLAWLARQCARRLRPDDTQVARWHAIETIRLLPHDARTIGPIEPLLVQLSEGPDVANDVGRMAFDILCDTHGNEPDRLLALWIRRMELVGGSERWAAAIRVSEHGAAGAAARPVLLDMHRSGDRDQARSATAALFRIGSPAEVVPVLQRTVETREDLIAADAAWELGKLGERAAPAVPALIDRVLDRSLSDGGRFSASRNAAAHSLGLIGSSAVAAIPALAVAPEDDRRLQEACSESIAQLGHEMDAGAAALLDLVSQCRIQRRAEAIRAVQLSGGYGPATIEAARALLHDSDLYVAAVATEVANSATKDQPRYVKFVRVSPPPHD